MNSHYFAQYLLNQKVLEAEQVQKLLAAADHCNVQLPLRALCQGDITPEQAAALSSVSGEELQQAMLAQGMLTESQVRNLTEAVTGESLRFAQAMFDEGIADYVQIVEDFSAYKKSNVRPVYAAVKAAAGGELEEELAYYSEYAELFLLSLIRFLDMPAVLDGGAVPFMAEAPNHIVSQRMSGDVSMVGGILAGDDVFLELARRYSHEELEGVDLLAIDCVGEFLNVMTGLFAVELGKRELDVDLEMPHWEKNLQPEAAKLLQLSLLTPVGTFQLILSADEFL